MNEIYPIEIIQGETREKGEVDILEEKMGQRFFIISKWHIVFKFKKQINFKYNGFFFKKA